ncbi:MAG: hypothetical protein ACI841_004776 [Planctomycetota bacterium]|jgi:hypothetical protein
MISRKQRLSAIDMKSAEGRTNPLGDSATGLLTLRLAAADDLCFTSIDCAVHQRVETIE